MSSRHDYRQDLELAVRAAREAGRDVLGYFGEDHEVTYKSPDQPLTDADLRADAILKRVLLGARPADGWLSEETMDSPDRLARDRVWIVDPIDGTKSFIERRPEYVVCVALAVRGEVEVGVVFNPSTHELFHAVRGEGAFRGSAPIHVSPGSRSLLASRSDLRSGEFDALRDAWEPTPLGSTAFKMVKVADGTAAAYVSRGPKSEWDLAAAALIVEEAGGVVSDAAGEPLGFNRPAPFLRGVVAAARETHEELVRRVVSLPARDPQRKKEAP